MYALAIEYLSTWKIVHEIGLLIIQSYGTATRNNVGQAMILRVNVIW